MLLIPCPWCGPRSQIEFTYGGDATSTRPTPRCARRRRGSPSSICATIPPARTTSCGCTAPVAGSGSACGATRARMTILASARARRGAAGGRRDDASAFVCRRAAIVDRVAAAGVRVRRRAATRAIPATRSPRRCSPTACTSSRAASSITGRAASSPPAARSRMRWCSSRAARAPSPTCARRRAELYDGLVAASQNRWPSLRFDVGAINDVLSRLLPAGFYYKTFMWPPSPQAWLRYEHVIRAAAGMGRAATAPDPDRYEHQYAHCDVLVVGGGPAGLAAARAAAHARCARDRVRRERRAGREPARRRRDDRRRRRERGSPPRRASSRRIRRSRCCRARPRSAATTATWSARRTRRRTSARRAAARAAGAAVEGPRQADRARVRCARARHRVRQQRPAGHDARRRGAHLRQALSRCARERAR